MTDILEILVTVKTMDEADVKTKYGTSSSNVRKVLKALLMDQMAKQESSRKEKETKKPKKATSSPSGSKSSEISPAK